jgi:hypothetical protein
MEETKHQAVGLVRPSDLLPFHDSKVCILATAGTRDFLTMILKILGIL